MDTDTDPPIAPAMPAQPAAARLGPWYRLWHLLHSRFARHMAMGAVAFGALAAGGHFVGGLIGWWHLYEVTFHAGKPSLQPSATDAKSRKLPRLSVVVLPLATEGAAQDGDWFTDNLSMDLTTELGRFSGALVISRDTAHKYKDKSADPRDVARELGVRYVVRGTVLRNGEAVRLDLAMIDGESGAQHWAQRFNLERANFREAIDDVAGQIGRSLSLQLFRAEGKRASALKAEEVEADDIAMQGWNVYFRGLSPANLLESQRLFEAAVAKDPASIRGWGGVQAVNMIGASAGWLKDRPAAIRRLQEAADRLQALDENDVFTFLARAAAATLTGEHEAQLLAASAMIERFPNHPSGHAFQGLALLNLGRFNECLEPAKRAIRLSPLDSALVSMKWQVAACHFMRGEYGASSEWARQAIQANPNFPLPHVTLAASLARDGRPEEARTALAAFRERNPAYQAEFIARGMTGRHPAFVEGRQRMMMTLRELGLP
jgi:TolB-like protein